MATALPWAFVVADDTNATWKSRVAAFIRAKRLRAKKQRSGRKCAMTFVAKDDPRHRVPITLLALERERGASTFMDMHVFLDMTTTFDLVATLHEHGVPVSVEPTSLARVLARHAAALPDDGSFFRDTPVPYNMFVTYETHDATVALLVTAWLDAPSEPAFHARVSGAFATTDTSAWTEAAAHVPPLLRYYHVRERKSMGVLTIVSVVNGISNAVLYAATHGLAAHGAAARRALALATDVMTVEVTWEADTTVFDAVETFIAAVEAPGLWISRGATLDSHGAVTAVWTYTRPHTAMLIMDSRIAATALTRAAHDTALPSLMHAVVFPQMLSAPWGVFDVLRRVLALPPVVNNIYAPGAETRRLLLDQIVRLVARGSTATLVDAVYGMFTGTALEVLAALDTLTIAQCDNVAAVCLMGVRPSVQPIWLDNSELWRPFHTNTGNADVSTYLPCRNAQDVYASGTTTATSSALARVGQGFAPSALGTPHAYPPGCAHALVANRSLVGETRTLHVQLLHGLVASIESGRTPLAALGHVRAHAADPFFRQSPDIVIVPPHLSVYAPHATVERGTDTERAALDSVQAAPSSITFVTIAAAVRRVLDRTTGTQSVYAAALSALLAPRVPLRAVLGTRVPVTTSPLVTQPRRADAPTMYYARHVPPLYLLPRHTLEGALLNYDWMWDQRSQ